MKKGIVFLIILVIVLLSVFYPHIMINPGELTEGHQKVKNECTACHKPFWGVETSRCISCHKLEEIGMKDSTKVGVDKEVLLFHSKLANTECTACHTDHQGLHPAKSLIQFDHGLLPAATRENCNTCHKRPTDSLHDKFSLTCGSCHTTTSWKLEGGFNHDMITGMEKSNCTACHKKPADSFHQSLKENCDKCHGTDRWKPSTFDHSSYFILDKDHNVECNKCHADNNFSSYTCYGCHEHSESKMISEHSEEGIYNISDCASCHRSGDEHDIRGRGESSGRVDSKDVEKIKSQIESKGKSHGDHEHDKGDD